MMTHEMPGPEQDQSSRSHGAVDDLGSQFEDLIAHVLHCERWARLDDRIALAVDFERRRRREVT